MFDEIIDIDIPLYKIYGVDAKKYSNISIMDFDVPIRIKNCFARSGIREGNAAVFAGAGLSRPSGYVVWKDLLKPLTDNIGLNIEDEHDLTIAAQYVRNKSGNRAAINASILDEFGKSVEINPNVEIITRLPIETYWTTNYDRLIEEGLRKANRNADVKIESRQLRLFGRPFLLRLPICILKCFLIECLGTVSFLPLYLCVYKL